jgi:hypothetical protein
VATVPQRFFAGFTALSVLIMSINCTCAGTMQFSDGKQCPSHIHSCCCQRSGQEHHEKKGGGRHSDKESYPCDGGCEHCRKAVINDNTASRDLSSLSVLTWASAFFAAVPFDISLTRDLFRSSPFLRDLPPPVVSPTLLSLGCALNT